MIEDVSRPEHDKSAPGNAAKQLQQTAIAGAVDSGWADDGDGQPGSRRGIAGDALGFHLRFLVDVTRPKRRVLVRRWMFNITVHAHRAAVNEAVDPRRGGFFDEVTDGGRVDTVIGRVGNPS